MLSSTVATAGQEKDVLEVRIEALLEAGVPIRTLIGHQLCSIDWLAARIDHKFRLCYHGERGEVIVESVSAARLLTRGRELGWHPLDEEPFELGWPDLFKEPLYHYRHGVHWYATAISDTDRMLPLAFPRSVLERDRLATEAAAERAGRTNYWRRSDGQWLDPRAAPAAGAGNPELATVGAGDRPAKRRRKSQGG